MLASRHASSSIVLQHGACSHTCLAFRTRSAPPSYHRRASRQSQQRNYAPKTSSTVCQAMAKPTSRGQKSAEQVKDVIAQDFKQRQYLVTGDLTESIYTKWCRVSDPTGVIWGIKFYRTIISNLFDPQRSSVKLKKIRVTGPCSIEAVWSKEGFLQLPWTPYLTTQEGKTLYMLNDAGLIRAHKQIWTNMTALEGIRLALTPRKR